ncbi:DUF3152 domain-containing protein [Streptomyces sp. PKU-MA01144]|uniref:DUF3152 domain-containing protein n=1 Tax=Streptomyces TaxID=1883 RepID=UPI00147DA31D|nr:MULTISPECIES: DUF3152 domain-containing protein [Streptomyces]MCY0985159.1 DUF3152 domain-containing protein [Streptomyces tirandamycinicus]NNJ04325.1 DUF3152 domain-containing protein [Streptomyces sp. PKU-MA01144]
MGRHSRKGPAPKAADTRGGGAGAPGQAAGPGPGRRRRPAGPPEHSGPAADGTPAHGVPQVRGGHPQQYETGGGWGGPADGGRYGDWQGVPRGHTAATTGRHPGGPATATTGQPPGSPPGAARPPIGAGARIPGPRREFVEAFDAPPPAGERTAGAKTGPGGEDEPPAKHARGRTVTGVAAAAVTTVLAVVVAGQVTDTGPGGAATEAAEGAERITEDDASRSDQRAQPPRQAAPAAPAAPPTYAQLMARQFPFDPELKGPGKFEAVPGLDRAPGKGRKIRYRVDVEQGLGLDGALFANAVQKTLNDERSWAHGGAMSFERISSGEPEFVITLASPGTTAVWCAKSGLDTTVDNVSCDSASTERVMVNAYRWAQGAETYGAKAMLPYRQMLINHEVGHRLGYGHVNCRTAGALAPVMQQQTKSLDIGGITCRPNPWAHPGG